MFYIPNGPITNSTDMYEMNVPSSFPTRRLFHTDDNVITEVRLDIMGYIICVAMMLSTAYLLVCWKE